MRFAALTDSGRARPNNQDAYGHRGQLYLVADGMGGHRAGEVASQLAVERILAAAAGADPLAELRQGMSDAHQAIIAQAARDKDCEGMGTTVAALVLAEGRAYIAHIGDSRVYRSRGPAALTLLTRDHSLVEEMVRQGSLSPEEARNHPQRSVLTRALGTGEGLRAEYAEADLEKGDIFLLCTDGLTAEVGDEEIAGILAMPLTPEDKAARLVNLANEQGGSDNITVIVVENDA